MRYLRVHPVSSSPSPSAVTLSAGAEYLLAPDGTLSNSDGSRLCVLEGMPAEDTVVERLAAVQEELEEKRDELVKDPKLAIQPGAARELSLAITHLEDARSRFTAGLARALGKFRPADLQKHTAEAERAAFYGSGSNEPPTGDDAAG